MSQRDFAPFLDNEIGRIKTQKNNSVYQGNEDYVFLCDNFLPYGKVFHNNTAFQSVPNF